MSDIGDMSIGEFSKITGLSVKALRFYHEKGILLPSRIDPASGYRFYDEAAIERARVVRLLRELGFAVEDIGTLLAECADDADALHYLSERRRSLAERVRHDQDVMHLLDRIVRGEIEARKFAATSTFTVGRRQVEPMLIAGVRMRGRYSDCGAAFAKLCRSVGRFINGKPMCLYYDCEYREDDADFEPCFPVRKQFSMEEVSVRQLDGATCLSLVHRGPYEQLGRSYELVLREARRANFEPVLPTREVYLKGPGMIFKGNPRNYLTEILLPFVVG